MTYELKDKIIVTEEFLNNLIAKSWQEIEQLQAQLANLADSAIDSKLYQLFKNLLTSYYVFIGGLETLSENPENVLTIKEPIEEITKEDPDLTSITPDEADLEDSSFKTALDNEINDPFEYFIDFEDPIGEPLKDEDLYGNQ